MNDGFTHEFSLRLYDKKARHIGEIDVRVGYRVNSFGSPARIRFDENDHPEESAEVDVYEVEMLNEPKSGRKAAYIAAWDWLYDEVAEWCAEHARELACAASLELASLRDECADYKHEQRRARSSLAKNDLANL